MFSEQLFYLIFRGESPAESDHNMLEIARKLEMYGITLYPAEDSDGVHLSLAVFNMGILVFQDKHKINTFSWYEEFFVTHLFILNLLDLFV